MPNNIVGIDLGTTFSALSVLNSIGKPEIVPNQDGDRITPSAVFYLEEENKFIVGADAINLRGMDPGNSIRWIKRQMGETYFMEMKEGKPEKPKEIAGKNWSPAELSSLILKKLKQDGSQLIGDISTAVITVPAYFDEIRRKATMDAAIMAGIEPLCIINEPTAAALFYAIENNISGRFVVFDLGGGTFDVTIVEIQGKDVNVLCSEGDHQLGGYDFDCKILELFEREVKNKEGVSLLGSIRERNEAEDRAEELKRTLSKLNRTGTMLSLPGGKGLNFELTRSKFEEVISPYIARIEMLIETALDEAQMKPSDADGVLLVGGSTRIPIVQQRIEKIFGFPPIKTVNVDEVVAKGAAYCAGLKLLEKDPNSVSVSISSSLSKVQLQDVCNHSYGTIVAAIDEITNKMVLQNSIIIPKNTAIPHKETKTYYTLYDGQEAISAEVTQGEDLNPEGVTNIAKSELDLPPNRPAGQPIDITYEYDDNERMHCTFHDLNSGQKLEFDVDLNTNTFTMNKQEERKTKMSLDDFLVE